MNKFGIKCVRLLELRNHSLFTAYIPPLYPIDNALACEFMEHYEGAEEELPAELSRYLERKEPLWFNRVQEVCGELPWIIRSSGEEDLNETTNAGAYLSLVCDRKERFYDLLAEVMLSGRTEHARNQNQRFVNRHLHDHEPIPVFIQPLVQSEHAGRPIPYDATPYLHQDDLNTVLSLIYNLHAIMPGMALDCEWVADTDYGTISMTSLTELIEGKPAGQLALGFHLFSTQHVTAGNSVRIILPNEDLNLWQGNVFQEVQIRNLFLVQTRPAKNYSLFQDVYELSAAAKRVLERDSAVCVDAKEIISQGGKPFFGKFIKAVTLNEAWNAYLQYMNKENKEDIAAVLVEFGTRTEHAGIMFNQAGIPVIRTDIALIPETMNYIVLDPFSLQCRLYSRKQEVRNELAYDTRKIIPLPDNCILIHHRHELKESQPKQVPAEEYFQTLLNKPYFSEKTRNHLLANSAYPDYRFVFHGKDGASSPSYYAAVADRLTEKEAVSFLNRREWPKASEDYFASLFHAKSIRENQTLAAYFDRPSVGHMQKTDILAYWKALRIQHLLNACGNELRETLLARIRSEMNESRISMEARLDILFSFDACLNALDIYSEQEETQLIQSFIPIVASVHDEDLPIVIDLSRNALFNAGHLCQFLSLAGEHRELFDVYRNYSLTAKEFALLPYDLSAVGKFPSFNQAFMDLHRELGKYDALGDLSSSIFHTVVETYDQSAKEILLCVIDDGDPSYYQAYIRLLTEWLGLIGQFDREAQVIRTFLAWLELQQGRQEEIEDYFLEEIHWKTRIEEARECEASELSLQNLHQLHNVLHQWSLNLVPDSRGALLPRFIREMVAFAQSFSEQENRLLRFQKEFFEIELAMCTHKAGFLFYPHSVFVEFSEPPSVDDDEIARLSAFASFMEKCGRWFEAYDFRSYYEKVAGTWTCYITVKAKNRLSLEQQDYRRIFHIIRFILDSSYDFSHNPLSEVEDLPQRFNEPEWKDIFGKLVDYRVNFDDAGQFINLKLFAMSTFFTYLCLSSALRERLLSLYRGGFEAMVRELAVLEDGMARSESYSEWLGHYESANYTSLFLSAIYPLQTVERLRALHHQPFTYDIVCRNLLKHKDAAYTVISSLPAYDKQFKSSIVGKLLRYCPAKYIQETGDVHEVAKELCNLDKSFKRAKQYLLYAHAHDLQPEVARKWIDNLQYVPYANEEAQETLESLLPNSGKYRYDIRKEILYI